MHTVEDIITDKSRRRAAQYLRTTPHMLENIETKEDLARLIETTLAPAWEKQVDSALALYSLLSPYAPKIHKNLDSMHIVYTDEQKRLYEQPLSDLPDSHADGLTDHRTAHLFIQFL